MNVQHTHAAYEKDLEDKLVDLISRSRCFAASALPVIGAQASPEVEATLANFAVGQVLEPIDDQPLEGIGAVIAGQMNALMPLYGDLALREDTHEHLVFDREVERLRVLMEDWKLFRWSRQTLRDRIAARAILRDR